MRSAITGVFVLAAVFSFTMPHASVAAQATTAHTRRTATSYSKAPAVSDRNHSLTTADRKPTQKTYPSTEPLN